jgi:hypothetical protein
LLTFLTLGCFCWLFLAASPSPTGDAPPSGAGKSKRELPILDGKFSLNLNDVPLLGSPEAPHVAVCLLDHTCYGCRVLHGQLAAAANQFSNKLAVVVLPTPLDGACNPAVKEVFPEHTNGCEYARLALAVWRANRSVFPLFDTWVFAGPVPPMVDEARQVAERLVGKDNMRSALEDPWVEQQLKRNVAIYGVNYAKVGSHSMPQLIMGTNLSLGNFAHMDDLYRALSNQFGLRQAP